MRAADVAVPANRRALVEFPAGRTTVRLPARFVHGAIVVRVQIGDRGVDFALDSGSDSIVIDPGTVADLGLHASGLTSEVIAGRVDSSLVRIPEMKIGELRMHDVVADVLPMPFKPANDVRLAGLLGFDFLDATAVTIDFAAQTVDATAPGSLVADPAASQIPGAIRKRRAGSVAGDRGGHRRPFHDRHRAQQANVILFEHFIRSNQAHDLGFGETRSGRPGCSRR